MNLRPHAHQSEDVELSIVPLVDVMLMLLVFFMLTTTFVHFGRIHVTLPEASVQQSSEKAPIVVTITRDGNFLVNERALVNSRPETLRAALARIAGENRGIPILVRADKRSHTQAIVTVMDVAGALGFKRINILTAQRDNQP
ncbi:MAG: biopolymer transporter ExbD [Gammaproteobacteria bacterium]|nr:biopolymer transporter ExbD [Gammaproteobacteria bacterium]